jgi:hypothetical protein
MNTKGLAFTFFGLCWVFNGLLAIEPLWLKTLVVMLSLFFSVKGVWLLFRKR